MLAEVHLQLLWRKHCGFSLQLAAVGVGDGSDFRYEMYEGRDLVHSLSLASLMHSVQEGDEKGKDKPQNLDAALLFNIPDAPAVKRDVKMMFFCSSVRSCSFPFFFLFLSSLLKTFFTEICASCLREMRLLLLVLHELHARK